MTNQGNHPDYAKTQTLREAPTSPNARHFT
jgi:hypothetical protein